MEARASEPSAAPVLREIWASELCLGTFCGTCAAGSLCRGTFGGTCDAGSLCLASAAPVLLEACASEALAAHATREAWNLQRHLCCWKPATSRPRSVGGLLAAIRPLLLETFPPPNGGRHIHSRTQTAEQNQLLAQGTNAEIQPSVQEWQMYLGRYGSYRPKPQGPDSLLDGVRWATITTPGITGGREHCGYLPALITEMLCL